MNSGNDYEVERLNLIAQPFYKVLNQFMLLYI